ncbi:acylhydrolase [Pedobacter sp. BMA]|nr:acylhydrolase [Pedobacter sp. BMA]
MNLFAQSAASDQKENFADDWARLTKYQKENDSVGQPKRGEKRVVFLGSSIFEFWKQKDPEYFEGKSYLDRGISGQISPQLLIRFRQDVIDLKPKVVIILAGSNDISGNTGHVTNEKIMKNIQSMAELAKLHHIKVILCKYLPINEYPWAKHIRPADQIIALNDMIEAYARKKHHTVLDYWTPLVDEQKGQRKEWSVDGVHPNLEGYRIMEKVTETVLDKVLKRR